MPRRARHTPGGLVYHVLNRGVARQTLFYKDEDYAAFERVLAEAHQRIPIRILAVRKRVISHFTPGLAHARIMMDNGASDENGL